LDEALRRASLALERHEREVVELETRLAMTRRTLKLAGYLGDSLPRLPTRTAPTPPRVRLALRRLRVAVG
jgi:hypothetical protein